MAPLLVQWGDSKVRKVAKLLQLLTREDLDFLSTKNIFTANEIALTKYTFL